MSLGGSDVASGHHHAHRNFERDMARQPMHSAGAGHQADPGFGQAEARMFGGDNDVAGERDFESAAEGKAVYGGDYRFDDIVTRGNSGKTALTARDRFALMSGGVLKVVAGGKSLVACARYDRNPRVFSATKSSHTLSISRWQAGCIEFITSGRLKVT